MEGGSAGTGFNGNDTAAEIAKAAGLAELFESLRDEFQSELGFVERCWRLGLTVKAGGAEPML